MYSFILQTVPCSYANQNRIAVNDTKALKKGSGASQQNIPQQLHSLPNCKYSNIIIATYYLYAMCQQHAVLHVSTILL